MNSILLIDDDREFCAMLRAQLAPHHIRLAMQHSGESGLRDLRARSYDMILLNVMLPGMSGLEVLSTIRTFSTLGILLLTTAASQAAGIAGLEQGADDYLSKPFDERELVSRIRAILRRTGRQAIRSQQRTHCGLQAVNLSLNSHPAAFKSPGASLTDVEHRILSTFMESPGLAVRTIP
jgi:DNA-binding response OmpR family regulator